MVLVLDTSSLQFIIKPMTPAPTCILLLLFRGVLGILLPGVGPDDLGLLLLPLLGVHGVLEVAALEVAVGNHS